MKDTNLLLFVREGYKGPYGPMDWGNIAVCSRNQICSSTFIPRTCRGHSEALYDVLREMV